MLPAQVNRLLVIECLDVRAAGGLGVGVDVGLLGSTLLIFVSEPDEAVAVPSLSFVCHAQP